MSDLQFLALVLIGEGCAVLIMAFVLAVMNRSLGYKYQKYWALAWASEAVYLALIGTSVYLLNLEWYPDSILRKLIIGNSLIFAYLKIYFLMIGTLVMCDKIKPTKGFHYVWFTVIAAASVAICLIPFDWEKIRYFFYLMVRSSIIVAVSFSCSYLIFSHVTGKHGARFFASLISAYGLLHIILTFRGFLFISDITTQTNPVSFSLAQTAIQVFLILSLVAWAIENEKEKVSKAQSKLESLAEEDFLTGLPNRYWFERNFEQYIDQYKRQSQTTAFLFIDLDNFKSINDSFGHDFGDSVLKKVADQLKLISRETDMLCRLGGDEFVWVLTTDNRQAVISRAEQLQTAIEKTSYIDEQIFSISVSIGIAWYPEHGKDIRSLMRKSDHALYEAKEQGKNCIIAA